jgi:hypothetical protein
MLPHFPFIDFPAGTMASTLRSSKPVLLLAILGAASGIMGEEVQKQLVAEVLRTYADRVIIKGTWDLELIQAMHVSTLWYFPPEHFNEIKVFQFVNMTAIMANELGFTQPARPSTSRLPMIGNAGLNRLTQKALPSDASKRDERRALLTCYILCGM